ncbi:MAG: molybdopterin converting factor subunit 1 [Gemmatimonadetes bacterium]|nr:molybdopterin converting factor subunit 1 [Gemmatimonadota bacterium]
MEVKVLFFASCRDLVGTPEASVSLPERASVADLLARLAEEHPRLQEMEGSLMVSVNQTYVDRTRWLSDGDEVAFIPPVSGGASADGIAGDGSGEGRTHVR